MTIIGAGKIKYHRKPARKKMKAYEQRRNNVIDCGYEGYKAYLASDEWKVIREKKLHRHPKCILCDKASTQVHHLNYKIETLLGMFPLSLVAMCGDCHHSIEFDGTEKRTLQQANKVLFKRANIAGKIKWVHLAMKNHKTMCRMGKAKREGRPVHLGNRVKAIIKPQAYAAAI